MKSYFLSKLNSESFLWFVIVFFFSGSLVFGSAFALLDSYDLSQNPDVRTYLAIAHFDFDENPVRRYRVIIPFVAAAINVVLRPVLSPLKPWDFPSDEFSLCMSFLLVNLLVMSAFGALVFKFCKSLGCSSFAAFIGLIAILSCRWVPYFVGLPIIDSLYLLVIICTLLSITTKNKQLATFAIFLGPWAKESYIFMVPLLFFYGPLPKIKQILFLGLSGLLVFSFRYYIDLANNLPALQSLESNFSTFTSISMSLKRFFSFHGLYELFSITGFWSFLLIPLLLPNYQKIFIRSTPSWSIYFIAIIFLQAFLSTELARMFYLFSPLLAFWIALSIDKFFKDRFLFVTRTR